MDGWMDENEMDGWLDEDDIRQHTTYSLMHAVFLRPVCTRRVLMITTSQTSLPSQKSNFY